MKVAVPFPYVWPLPCGPHVYLQNCVACSDEDRVHLLLQQTDSQHQLYTAAVHIDTIHTLSPVLMFLILSNLFDDFLLKIIIAFISTQDCNLVL